MVYSSRRFVLSLALCYFILVFKSFEHCDYLAWGRVGVGAGRERERAKFSAFSTLFDLHLFVSSSAWCLGRAAPCD